MYKKIEIKNFRAIRNLKIDDCGYVNLLVGKNNCGKTTFLEGVFLLTGGSNPDTPLKMNQFRGLSPVDIENWRTFFNKLDIKIKIDISGNRTHPYEDRTLYIEPSSRSGPVPSQGNNKKGKVDFGLSQSGFAETEIAIDSLMLQLYIKKRKNGKSRKFTSRIIRKDSEVITKRDHDFKDDLMGIFVKGVFPLGEIVQRYHAITMKKQDDKILQILRDMEPNLNSLTIGGDGLIYCDIGLDRRLPINVMGDGMVKIFSSIADIVSMPNGVALFDEIDNGLHYSSMRLLWDAVFKAAYDYKTQIFATTHSQECVKAFAACASEFEQRKDMARLFRIDRKDDAFKITKYNDKELLSSLESGWEVR